MQFTGLFTVSVLMAALAACSGVTIDQADGMKPKGSAFLTNLHAEYIVLARSEADEFDFPDADHFASKAMKVGKGTAVNPDLYTSRNLPSGSVGDLKAAGVRLNTALDGGARKYASKAAAHAQAMYDCWLQEQEENNQPADIKRCRSAFLAAMGKVDAAKPMKKVAKAEPKPKPKPKKKKKKPYLGPFFIYFPFDVADPEDAFNGDILDLIASTAKKVSGMKMSIVGHTDRAGDSDYNMVLSGKRALNVKAALLDRGVNKKQMNYSYKGEDSPATPTKDGVRADNNRRVEVSFK